jgi:HAMP domain-containing protein
VIDTANGTILRTVIPVRNREQCQRCHDPLHRINGILILDSNVGALRASMNGELRWMVLASGVLTLVLVAAVGFIVRIAVLRRLQRFETTARLIAAGDLARRVPAGGSDTISWLAREFNTMADSMAGLVGEVRDQRGVRLLAEQVEARAGMRIRRLQRDHRVTEHQEVRPAARALHRVIGMGIAEVEVRARGADQVSAGGEPPQADAVNIQPQLARPCPHCPHRALRILQRHRMAEGADTVAQDDRRRPARIQPRGNLPSLVVIRQPAIPPARANNDRPAGGNIDRRQVPGQRRRAGDVGGVEGFGFR